MLYSTLWHQKRQHSHFLLWFQSLLLLQPSLPSCKGLSLGQQTTPIPPHKPNPSSMFRLMKLSSKRRSAEFHFHQGTKISLCYNCVSLWKFGPLKQKSLIYLFCLSWWFIVNAYQLFLFHSILLLATHPQQIFHVPIHGFLCRHILFLGGTVSHSSLLNEPVVFYRVMLQSCFKFPLRLWHLIVFLG